MIPFPLGAWVKCVVPVTGDLHYGYTMSLLDADYGQAGSTSAVDRFNYNEWTNFNTVLISDAAAKSGTLSYYFDGVNAYLRSGTGIFRFGDSDFTIEFFIKPTQPSQAYEEYLFALMYDTNNTLSLRYKHTSTEKFTLMSTNAGAPTSVDGTVTGVWSGYQSTWTHLAVVRQGTSIKLYVNGVLDATLTATLPNFSGSAYIQYGTAPTIGSNYEGYMDDMRVTSYARYTDTFTVPTTPYEDYYTVGVIPIENILFHADMLGKGASGFGNPANYSKAGNLTMVSPSELTSSQSYNGGSSYSNVPGGNRLWDQSPVYHYGETYGDTISVSFWFKANSTGGSGNDYLTLPWHNGSTDNVALYFNHTTSKLCLETVIASTPTSYAESGTTTWDTEMTEWIHFGIEAKFSNTSDGFVKLYKNGTNIISQTGINVFYPTTRGIIIGSDATNTNPAVGYFDEYMITRGERWAGNFTPPTTKEYYGKRTVGRILLNFDDQTLTDVYGHTPQSTTPVYSSSPTKYGAYCLDKQNSGVIQYNLDSSSDLWVANKDFHIEMWFYPNSIPGSYHQLISVADSSGNEGFYFRYGNGGFYYSDFFLENSTSGGTAFGTLATYGVTAGAWSHFAFVKRHNRWSYYLNGTRVNTGTVANNNDIRYPSQRIYIGSAPGHNFKVDGYIDDVRLIVGDSTYAPIQSSIVVPTAHSG